MEPFYVKNKESQLYSVYYEPKVSANNGKGVVLCYPVGQEYIRCHRMYDNLARKLARQGIHTVKFDYSGTGDSGGDFSSARMAQWVSDIAGVAAELREGSDVQKLYVVGVRLGGLLALRYAEQAPVDGLVLLSPVVNGTGYLKEIQGDYNRWLSGSFARKGKTGKGEVECHGFLYSRELTGEINGIRPEAVRFPTAVPALIIDEDQSFADVKNIPFQPLVNKKLWQKKQGEEDKDVLPVRDIDAIVEWVSRN
jgi:pimeloyl-ACP methyl ester carboxylesterase